MSKIFQNYRYLILLLFIFIISEVIVMPTGNFPLNDDWSYAKSVSTLVYERKLDIGQWPAMTLLTHLLWGSIFVKIFGFSFFVLHFSSIVSSLIGLYTMYKIVFRITTSERIAFFSALTLLFNPFHFNLSNTFMTDVNFNTLMLLACYFTLDFFAKPRWAPFIAVGILSIALVLLRQFGLIVPLSLLLCSFFMQEKKKVFLPGSALLFVVVLAALHFYEIYLKSVLPSDSAYKFAASLDPTRLIFWETLFEGVSSRYKMILFHVLNYSFPFAVLFLPAAIESISGRMRLLLIPLVVGIIYLFFLNEGYQMSNVFNEMSLGTETFYEVLKGTDEGVSHTISKAFEITMKVTRVIFVAGSLITIICFLISFFSGARSLPVKPGPLFLLLLIGSYSVLLFLTDSFFDRYHIPLISISVILLAYFARIFLSSSTLPLIIVAFFAWISVLGTKDYFTLNKTRWQAYEYLYTSKKVDPGKINGGFEVNCWNGGKPSWWYAFMDLKEYDYIIQYDSEPGFRLMRSFEFQRYFPYKRDKLNIFERVPGTATGNK